MSNFYEQLCESFIKPTRQTYHRHDLGQAVNAHGKRTDFHITNKRKLKLVCSFYSNNLNPSAPCLVYLHGFNGSRLESLVYVERVLATGINMCAFDFSGTGLSEGEYVSLGAHEQFDILDVLDHVSQNFQMKKYILWGRSMGAAAAIKFSSLFYSNKARKNPRYRLNFEIISIVLDSPFYSLNELAIEIAKSKVKIPEILIKAVLALVKSTIQSKASFDMNELELLADASFIRCPVLLIASKQDQLIHYSHADKIYKAILHKQKQILFIRGEHYDMREEKVIKYILKFIESSIMKPDKNNKNKGLDSSNATRGFEPLSHQSHQIPKDYSHGSIPRKNILHYSIETQSPLKQYGDRMKTDGSIDQNSHQNYIKEMLNEKRSNTPNSIWKQKEKEKEKISNKYKKPYFNIQPTPQFGTPHKLKLKSKSKRHIQSQQILETKHFFSDKKIDEENSDDFEEQKQIKTPSNKVVDVKRIKETSLKQIQNKAVKTTQKGKQFDGDCNQSKKTQTIRLLNPNIRILSSSVEYLDSRTAEENSPRKQSEEVKRGPPQIEVNHLNVISSKLKKNRKHRNLVLNTKDDKIRKSSVSMERKWLLKATEPPAFAHSKTYFDTSLEGAKNCVPENNLYCK